MVPRERVAVSVKFGAMRDASGARLGLERGASVVEIAIAWVIAQGADILPVLGARPRQPRFMQSLWL